MKARLCACPLAGIARLGLAWDVAFGVARIRRPWLASVLAVHLGLPLLRAAMALAIRSDRWIAKGLGGWLERVGIAGTLTAAVRALVVPVALRPEERAPRRTGPRVIAAGRQAWVAPLAGTTAFGSHAIGAQLR